METTLPSHATGRRLLAAFLLASLAALPVAGQAAGEERAPIQDNSFLVEEAYNQEAGVVQHINTFSRARGGGWAYSFTQEWPAPGLRHQLSFSLPFSGGDGAEGRRIGDVALNYRYQWLGGGDARVAFAPRFSLLLPTGSVEDGRGAGSTGLQVNLPLSYALAPGWSGHSNAGATFTPSAENGAGAEADTWGYNLAQSLIWEATPRFNVMLEAAWQRAESVSDRGLAEGEESFFLSPGIRWAHDFANGLQIVPGLAFPIGVGPSDGERQVFVYLSFEHPFL
jgi:hypothetical protein